MRWLRAWAIRLRGSISRRRFESELHQELESNLQMHVDENMQSGMTPDEARRAALIKFGNLSSAKEAWRDRRGIPFLETLARDVSYTLRMLRQNKGWASVAILSLTLGIGVNTALFAVVNDILLQKLPVPNPDDLISLRWVGENNIRSDGRDYGYSSPDPHTGERRDASFSLTVFQQFRTQSESVAEFFAVVPSNEALRVSVNGQLELASGQYVSGNFYSVLGVSAVRGRTITPADDMRISEPVIMISHRYWELRLGMDPGIVGSSIVVNNVPVTIVGITPSGFGGVLRIGEDAPDISIPLAIDARIQPNRSLMNRPTSWAVLALGRLKPGATAQQIQARLEAVFDRTAREEWTSVLGTMTPERRSEAAVRGSRVPRLQVLSASRGVYDFRSEQTRTLTILGVLVGLILFIVCLNLANLMLSRAATRKQEITLRVAIGATRKRLIQQLLTESVVVAGIGGSLGLLAAYWCRALLPVWFGFSPVALDRNVIAFTCGITVLTAIMFGLAPAIRATRTNVAPAVREGSLRLTRSRSRLSQSLLIAQVALCMALMMGAGLLLRTLSNLLSQDVGFDADNLALFYIDPRGNQYDSARTAALYQEIWDRLRSTPGVRSVSLSDTALLARAAQRNFISIEGLSERIERHNMVVYYNYFETMGIPLKAGRGFTPQDDVASSPIVVINEAFAREFFPNTNPIGRHFAEGTDAPISMEIVGVVGDVKFPNLRDPAPPTFYMPHLQRPSGPRWFEVRTAGDASTMIPAIRDVVRSIDGDLQLQRIFTQTEGMGGYVTQERLFALTMSLFGGLALAISMIGIFGLMSYSVARRTKEIGIRMALGARRSEILRSVLSETLFLVLLGVAVGIGVAIGLTRFILSMLYGLAPHDPTTIGAVVLVMVVMALLASYFPARRASRVDPMIALRYE